MSAVSRYDVAIIGGGLVGASLACALAPRGLKVVLLEAVAFRAEAQPSYDDRTLALSASSCRILAALDLWSALRENATPIREILVRELNRPGKVVLKPEELGLDCFGHVVEARAFGAAVTERLPRLENLDLRCPAAVRSVQTGDESARIEYSDDSGGGRIEAALMVAADGANSFIRESLGIEAERHDYGQSAVICNITPEQPHHGRAFELFTPSGPFAVMPHVNGRCGLIWCVARADTASVMALPEQEFLRRAYERFGDHLGSFLKMGRRSSYELRLVRARDDRRERALILGNAAHAIHPIGAQGFNLGLRDVAVLAEVLADAFRRDPQTDAGGRELLRRYSDWRKVDQDGTIAYSDGLARLFSNPTGIAAAARTAGLVAHALLPPLRRQMAVRAMGFRGRIPRMALGEPL
ncbi:MAG: 2-octaprenyl-6-methoxyphenyl hydroxylase [Xanthomonadales bacterium]|nr:2-octaprenyl-6-methoxyphenyl hydroxylase [Xanthomonadales bacterium]